MQENILRNIFIAIILYAATCISKIGVQKGICQNVGINLTGNPANASSILDVDATDRGLLIPRMTTAQRDNIAITCSCTPATGLQIFNTDINCFQFYAMGIWTNMGCATCAPTVNIHPLSTAACVAGNNSYSVIASGSNLTYQWQENQTGTWNNLSNGGVYSNVTTATLNLTGVTAPMNSYQYRAVVSGSCSPSATTNAATLTVTAGVPAQPSAIAGIACRVNPTDLNGNAYSVTNVAGVTYTWSVNNGSAIASGQGTNAVTVNFAATNATHTITVTPSNGCGSGTARTLAVTVQATACPPECISKTYGGTLSEAFTYKNMCYTTDGGYAVVGSTNSFGAGGYDFWVLKLDGTGTVIWQKTFGGASSEIANSIVQTTDGGYAVAGYTNSSGAGGWDFYVLKLDAAGAIVWQKTFGGASSEIANSIVQTTDGGYAVAGYGDSFGAGSNDLWVLKLDAAGAITWQKTYGGADSDAAYSIVQTIDGGYAIACNTYSFDVGGGDFWVLKLDGTGVVTWQKTFGGVDSDAGLSIVQTIDGGYAVAGITYSFGAGSVDFWVLKLDGTGSVTWQKTFGGASADYGRFIVQTDDGGYAVTGNTVSFGAGSGDLWVLKLDGTGTVTWQKTFGGAGSDDAYSIVQSNDGGYAVAGITQSFGAGDFDFWLVKTNSSGVGPSCNTNTAVSGANTGVTGADTGVTGANTGVTGANTAVTGANTAVTPANACATCP